MKTLGIILTQEPSGGGGFQYESTLLKALFQLADETQLFKLVILAGNPASLWDHNDNHSFLSYRNARVIPLGPLHSGSRDFVVPPTRERCKLFKIPVDENLKSYLTGMGVDALFCLSPTFKGIQSGLPFSMPIWDLAHKHQFRVHYPEVFDNEEPSYRDLLYVNACLSAHTIIAESEAGKEDILRQYGTVITEGKVKILDFIPKQLVPRILEHAFPSEAILPVLGKRFFYYPAQFWRHKHHDTLIKALKMIDADMSPDISLVFSGSTGDYHRAQWHAFLLKLASELDVSGRVFFAGYIPNRDVEYLYTHAVATLMPSAFGPSNLPPLEAIALSCPVAVGDAYGMQRFLPHGVPILPYDDSQPWADFMARSATDPDFRIELIKKQRQNLADRSFARFKSQVLASLPF
jgi:glycosyltransferase involved in cell wall biosynthesis